MPDPTTQRTTPVWATPPFLPIIACAVVFAFTGTVMMFTLPEDPTRSILASIQWAMSAILLALGATGAELAERIDRNRQK